MSWTVARELERGHAAWTSGRLDEAIERLSPIERSAPGLLEAVLPLARAHHERGDSGRALEYLADVLAGRPKHTGVLAHRAAIHFDLGDDEALARDLSLLGRENAIPPAYHALVAAREGRWSDARFPRTALWTAEWAGRLLAILERRWAERVSPAEDRFHHGLYSPRTAPDEPTEPPALLTGQTWNDKDWDVAIEAAFVGRHFARFLEIFDDPRAPDAWRAACAPEFRLYATWASAAPDDAVRTIETTCRAKPSLDAWFILGLAQVRAADPRAAFSFIRAARQGDIAIHDVIHSLAKEMGWELAVRD